MVMEIVFWGALGLIAYTYVGFPLLLFLRGLIWRRPVKKAPITPSVSLVIVAYNEEASIGAKLENVLRLDYPRDRLQVIVASDGSSDRTEEIVASFADQGVQLLAFPRQGKIPALNQAVAHATGEILIFSDANSMYKEDALRKLVAPFADEQVGAVGGNQCYFPEAEGEAASFGERLYWAFDRQLKVIQSRAGNMTSATGAIHAIRRELFQPVPPGVTDDFTISTRAIAQGYRLVFEPEAIAYESVASSDKKEFRRKQRIMVRGLRGVWTVRELLNPWRHGFYSLQLFTHKVLRRGIAWLLIPLFAASLALYGRAPIYTWAALGQLAFYGSALAAFGIRRTSLRQVKLFRLLSIPYYFCLTYLAALMAWIQFLRGKRIDLWDSTRLNNDSHPEESVGLSVKS